MTHLLRTAVRRGGGARAVFSTLSASGRQPVLMDRPRWFVVIPVAATALLIGGCSSGGGTSASAGASSAPASDANPLGDIPDNQVYVPYTPADGPYSVKVPEGWARTDLADGVSFTDKLNTVTVQQRSGTPEPNHDSVLGSELTDIAAQGHDVALGPVETRTLPGGTAVHATYAADSTPDPVTGRVTRDDVELYVFWNNGTEVLLTLSGPHGSDDVDAWRLVSTSFMWT